MTTIITKNSSTAAAVPLAADLVQGELAVNVTDKRIYTENASGTVVELGTTPSSVTTGAVACTTLSATGNVTLGDASTDTLNVGNGGIVKDASGNVGIGTSSPNRPLEIKATNIGLRLNNTTAGGNAGLEILPSASGKSWLIGAAYNASNAFEITPSTTNGGTTYTTPAMVIDSSGNLLVGTTTATGIGGVTIAPNYAFFNNSSTSLTVAYFQYNNSTVGSISRNTTTTTYATSSDYRLKENIAPMTGALDTVAALKPCTYSWKSNGESTQGFIAHELQAVVPEAVVGIKDAVDSDGNPVYQGIDTSFLVATLTAAIQELKTIVDAQAARITALEQA